MPPESVTDMHCDCQLVPGAWQTLIHPHWIAVVASFMNDAVKLGTWSARLTVWASPVITTVSWTPMRPAREVLNHGISTWNW